MTLFRHDAETGDYVEITPVDLREAYERVVGVPEEIGEIVTKLQGEILRELLRGERRFGGFNSFHELYAVLQEEVDEFWDRVKGNDYSGETRHELVQVAAIATRGVLEFDRLAR